MFRKGISRDIIGRKIKNYIEKRGHERDVLGNEFKSEGFG